MGYTAHDMTAAPWIKASLVCMQHGCAATPLHFQHLEGARHTGSDLLDFDKCELTQDFPVGCEVLLASCCCWNHGITASFKHLWGAALKPEPLDACGMHGQNVHCRSVCYLGAPLCPIYFPGTCK